MKRIWVPFLVLLLLPASYSVQRPAGRPENAQPPYEDSIRSQTQEAGETILYFPDYVDGGGWSVQLALSNVDPDTAAEAVVEVYDEFGGPILDLFDSGSAFEIPPLGSRVLRSSGTGEIRRGWIQVRAGAASVSGLLTYKQGTTGIEVSVEPAALGDRFALFVEESGDVGAGVAVFKPEAASSIQLRVRDEAGSDPLEGAFVSRGNFHQSALTLPEWFDAEGIDRGFLRDFRGLLFLRAEDESRFAPLGLRFGKRDHSLSSVPAIGDPAQNPLETILYFPDYVDGSGWSVQLALSNVDAETAAQVSVEVFDTGGQSIRDLFASESAFQIPAELGSLAALTRLNLGNNDLNGSIPPALGGLANLESLWLEGNALAGSVPPELGGLTNLKDLRLQDNELKGTLPPEFGGLENLTSVVLARNGRLAGALPARLTDLGRLEEFLAADTNLCAPSDAGFLDWLSGVPKRRVGSCGAEAPPAAYLSQAVQSRDHPVPLVAGEEALLRVFVESSRESGANFPPVRATFYRNGARTHVVDIPGKPVPIPREIREGDLNASANAQIPGRVVQPGLEVVIDVDPEGMLGPDPGVMKQIPESGRLAVDVRTMPVFELTMIPFLWTPSPDSSIVEVITSMARDPGGHPLLSETRNLLPINELDVKAREELDQ